MLSCDTRSFAFDPLELLLNEWSHDSICSKFRFWSIFKSFELDQFFRIGSKISNNQCSLSTAQVTSVCSKFRFWSSSNKLKVDQKWRFAQFAWIISETACMWLPLQNYSLDQKLYPIRRYPYFDKQFFAIDSLDTSAHKWLWPKRTHDFTYES